MSCRAGGRIDVGSGSEFLTAPEACYYESNLTGTDLSPGGARAIMWTDSGAWLPGAREIHWVGRANGCGNDERPYLHMVFEEATGLWTIDVTTFNPCGHGYDHNTADPDTDTFYFRPFNDDVVSAWDGASWTPLPPLSGPTSSAAALAYFPGYGLVWATQSAVHVYDGVDWSQTDLPNQIGSLHHVAEYNPVEDVLVFGGGNDASRRIYRMERGGAFTQLADAPLDLGTNGQSGGTLTVDPLSGRYLALDKVSAQWWEFDAGGDTWQETDTPPPVDPLATFQVPIPTWGLIGFLEYAGGGDAPARFWVYKHSPGDPPGPGGDTGGSESGATESTASGPEPDTGASNTAGGGTTAAGTDTEGADSGGTGGSAGADADESSGCSCRAPASPNPAGGALLLLALLRRRSNKRDLRWRVGARLSRSCGPRRCRHGPHPS